MRLIITRHGETHQNAAKISMGQKIGGDLNDAGLAQARQLARQLASEHLDHIYSSDLQRAADTTRTVAHFHRDTPVTFEPLLQERNLGVYEGGPSATWKEAMQQSPEPFHLFRPEGGESYADLQARITPFVSRLFSTHLASHDSVLLLSHAGVITVLLLTLLQKQITRDTYDQFKPDNTAITILDIAADRTVIPLVLNSTKHLIKNEQFTHS